MFIFLFVDNFNDLDSSFEVSRIYQKRMINCVVKMFKLTKDPHLFTKVKVCFWNKNVDTIFHFPTFKLDYDPLNFTFHSLGECYEML